MRRAELTDRITSPRIDGGERAIDLAFPPPDLDGLERLAAARSSCRAYRSREDALDLSEDRSIVCAVAFGYPQADHVANNLRTTRVAVGEFADLVRTPPLCAPTMDDRSGS